MESTRLVQSVLRFCGQLGWPNSLGGEGALGGCGSVRPHFHSPTSKNPRSPCSLVPRHSTMRDEYPYLHFRTGTAQGRGRGAVGMVGMRAPFAALNEG